MPNYSSIFRFLLMILIIYQVKISYALKTNYDPSPASSCGSLQNISYPFQITNPHDYRLYAPSDLYWLSCEKNHTVLEAYSNLYVEAINYHNYTIRVVDRNVRKDICSSMPLYPSVKDDFISKVTSTANLYLALEAEIRFGQVSKGQFSKGQFSKTHVHQLAENLIFLSCEKPLKKSGLLNYIDTSPCFNGSALSQHRRRYSYVLIVDSNLILSNLEDSCRIDQMTLISTRKKNFSSYRDMHNELAFGFELSWVNHHCRVSEYQGRTLGFVDQDSGKIHCLDDRYARAFIEILLPLRILGAVIVIAFLIYKWQRRHFSMYDSIEEFLQSHNNLMPRRYSYLEIKMMTRDFKNKLGEGGFGSVYKGRVSSGRFVAIKMLDKSKANGQDFINEVATIGRIHHVNVVQLIGFCVSGSKRALVYDFMPNGSLDRYIFQKEGINNFLSYSEIYKISLGVARGIEYLHQGCDMQILHFDIKPHNILLDENFIPKVSDFGLARSCPLNNSIVSVTAARGTLGYMAPELFYKNIGGVSYRADVYSFGMLLMEMANKRKNLNANAKNSSQIYFPLWIYDQFINGKELEIEDTAEDESKMVKKMIIVALWCIQLKPCDRPSMNKVIEMLEGEVESLEMPPKPYLYPREQEEEKHSSEDARETSCSSTLSMEGAP